jgi:hypothetical protein
VAVATRPVGAGADDPLPHPNKTIEANTATTSNLNLLKIINRSEWVNVSIWNAIQKPIADFQGANCNRVLHSTLIIDAKPKHDRHYLARTSSSLIGSVKLK